MDSFIARIKAAYGPYKDLEGDALREVIFATRPGSGACCECYVVGSCVYELTDLQCTNLSEGIPVLFVFIRLQLSVSFFVGSSTDFYHVYPRFRSRTQISSRINSSCSLQGMGFT